MYIVLGWIYSKKCCVLLNVVPDSFVMSVVASLQFLKASLVHRFATFTFSCLYFVACGYDNGAEVTFPDQDILSGELLWLLLEL